MSGVYGLNILCSGTVAARVDRVGGPNSIYICSVNLYTFPKIRKTQAQMRTPHYFYGSWFQVGLWSHKWHFEASTSHRDQALFDLGVRSQKARDLQIPDHPFS